MAVFIVDLFFNPPMAVARVGTSSTPQDAYEWEDRESPDSNGIETVIRPAPSFDVAADGSLRTRLPESIRFKDDNGDVRPVAPFLEVWARVHEDDGLLYEVPLTLGLLTAAGAGLDNIRWTVTAANNKAFQRTGAPNCRFEARVVIPGDDHESHALDAVSPVSSGQTPLVSAAHPIRLGRVQVVKPTEPVVDAADQDDEVDLSVLRIRFTPGWGFSYAPPDAVMGVSSPLEPGDMAPTQSLYGNIWEIVPEERRILNPGTEWSKFVMDSMDFPHGTPIDAYDGANVGTSVSWGVVDDSCDAIVEARLVVRGQAFTARARVFSGPQDYAPDRRNFHSVTDDVEDRELPSPHITAENFDEYWPEVLDLFRRIFETASLFNLDMHRNWATGINAYRLAVSDTTAADWDDGTIPRIGPNSMTARDAPYAEKTPALIPDQKPSIFSEPPGHHGLPYTDVVDFAHAPLADPAALESFLRRRPDRVRELIRAPLGRIDDLPERPGVLADDSVRDPRLLRDRLYDMRMPPFMRHTMGYPLTLTYRQYDILMGALDHLERSLPTDETEATDDRP